MNERIKRQSEVSKTGSKTEEEVVQLLTTDKEINENLIIERYSKLPKKLKKLIDKDLSIYYKCGGYQKIDADICILDRRKLKLLAVISVKKSFRERGAQAVYWALKIKLEGKPFKYVLATPDVDKEIFDPQNPTKKRKWRIILPCEFEKVFVYSYEGKVFEENNFYVGKDYFIEWVKSLI